MIKEQLSSLLVRALETLCRRFYRATREIQEIVVNALKRVDAIKEDLLDKNEKNYVKLCARIFDAKGLPSNKGGIEPSKKKIKLQPIPDGLSFTEFSKEFFEKFFMKIFITI